MGNGRLCLQFLKKLRFSILFSVALALFGSS
uniref:Uncharacterized protein n=1 Tax=Anguilla anguilla TaxID=7936 RepID=A0A0E9UB79_ANGAN